jgi:molybdopterin converting factor subunit 1
LYFAAIRDLAGLPGETCEVPDGLDVAGLAAWLEARHEPLSGRLAHVRFARNAVFASPSTRVEDGDEIAVIPPVSGG